MKKAKGYFITLGIGLNMFFPEYRYFKQEEKESTKFYNQYYNR